MKRVRRLIAPFLLLFCVIMGSIYVSAADELLGTVVDGSLLTNETEAESIVYPRARGSFLSSGTEYISIAGPRSVTVSGSTTAYMTVDKVRVTLYLQRLENGSWEHVTTLGPKTAYNDYYVSNSNTYSVKGGYYYRVYGGHTAIKGGSPESLTSFTNGVWVP